jgi:hypothetical protein
MRRVRAALTALFLALLSVFAAGPASAGGPTSALLVWPDSGRTASLYASDDDYTELARLVGALEPDGYAGEVSSTGAGHDSGPMVTVTWLIHDVQVWRVDRIYPAAEGGPWISTQVAVGGTGSIWDSQVVWHTAADGPALAALLDRLGLGAASSAASGPASGPASDAAAGPAAGSAAGPDATPAPGQAAGPSEDAASDPGGWPGWAWGLAGLAMGAALAVVTGRVRGRRTAESVEEAPWPVGDELSSAAPRSEQLSGR